MKRFLRSGFLKKKLARILISGIVAALLLGGGTALAYTMIWSGTASITIEEVIPASGGGGGGGGGGNGTPEPEPLLPLTISDLSVTKGVIEGGVWTVTLLQGDNEALSMYVINDRDTLAEIEMLVNGEHVNSTIVAPGVTVDPLIGEGFVHNLVAHSSLIVEFKINVDEAAEPGVLSDILLGIREKE